MKKFLFTILFVFYVAVTFSQNLTLEANLPYPFPLSNIGGYVDVLGNEYALVGSYDGLSIVDVTVPTNPVEKFAVPGLQSDWREVKTWSHYAYVTTEAGGGLQIINLQYLPDSVQVKQYTGDAVIAGQLSRIHALHIDNGYVYLFGGSLLGGAAKICDLNADPWNPHYLGHTPGPYIHDGYVRNDTLWAAHIYDGFFRVYNCADKTNPVYLAEQITPGAFTHNTWLSADSHTLFTTDEVSNSFLTSYDVSDLANIHELDRYQPTPGSGSIVHNTQIISANGGEFAVTSWYKDGVVITDVTRPQNIVEIARYDTYPQGSGSGYDGDWGVYPYLPSGTIVVSDIENGLFVFSPNYARACYLEGVVTDSLTGIPLNNVNVQIIGTPHTANSDITGNYSVGTPDAGIVDVSFTRPGYIPKTIYNVSLNHGLVTQLNVQLASMFLTGQVLNAATGDPVPNAKVRIENSTITDEVTTDASGNFISMGMLPGNSLLTAGKWAYRDNCININLPYALPVTVLIDSGYYYDDFTLDYNWTVTGNALTGMWTRAIPVGTTYNSMPANPGVDATGDCSDFCFVTGNNGGGFNTDDVDNGFTQLTSPFFDLSSYSDPYINYERWFADFGGGDSMRISLSNGTISNTIETIIFATPGSSAWQPRSFRVLDFMTPSSTMHLTVYTADVGSSSILECGLDKFLVSEGPLGLATINNDKKNAIAYPNPFADNLTVSNNELLIKDISVFDLTGREIVSMKLNNNDRIVKLNFRNIVKGVYILKLNYEGERKESFRIMKM